MICKTATGREIPVSLMIRGRRYPVLTIFSPAEAETLQGVFSDPKETVLLTEIREDGTTRTFEHFTRLRSVSSTTVATGSPEWMVWLDQELPKEEEETT